MPSASQSRKSRFDTGEQQVGAVYAKALLAAAENAGRLDAVVEELDSFIDDVLDRQPGFEGVLNSALVSHEEKVGLLDRTLASQASPLFLTFLKVVSGHGRLDCLRAVRSELHELYNELRGRLHVEVTTAAPLDEASAARIREVFNRMGGGEPQLECETDPELIGGVVVRVGDTVFDGSIARQLEQVREQMIDRSVHEIQSRRDRFRNSAGN